MLKKGFLCLSLFIWLNASGQIQKGVLTATVDTTAVKIGEQIDYYLQIKADSTSKVVFPEQPLFAPFELLEVSQVDTIRSQSHFLYTKKYSLIHFDSGNYYIPQQQVLVDGFSQLAKLIPIRVNTVKVDTTKQKLFDIKPLQKVKRNYEDLIIKLAWFFVFVIVITGILYIYFFQKNRQEFKKQELPPFERAIEELKALENESLTKQEEFKSYYSRLTDVIRRYLEEEAKIDALESTSEELLLKLEMRKDAGTLDLDRKTLISLREVLQNADLAKFARSMPEFRMAYDDRKVVENVVIETKEALPEPTEEELKEKAAYQELLAKKKRKQQLIFGLVGTSILGILTLLISILIYGYYPVRDTLLAYPTKVLYSGQWVMSQYGNPPIKIETPDVLERIKTAENDIQQFAMGTFDSSFYIDLLFNFPNKKSSLNAKEDKDGKGAALVNAVISNFESKGAVNILMKNDELQLPSGLPVAKIYGTLDYPKMGKSERVRCSFNALLFTFEEGTIILTMMYEKEDRYGSKIEQRIINSLELIKEL